MENGLKQLGLNRYEQAIYLTLLERGKMDAKQIARFSEVPITAVYPNLKNLEQKGLIQTIQGEINLFEATNPETALKGLVNKKIKTLNETQKQLLPLLNAKQHQKELTSLVNPVELLQGSESSKEVTKQFAERSKKSLHILGWRLQSKKAHLLNELRHAVERGTAVKIIFSQINSDVKKFAKFYVNAGIQVKYFPIQNFSITIRDREECKITLKSNQMIERAVIHIQDNDLSKALDDYFQTIWNKAEKI